MKRKKKQTAGERKPNWKEYMATVEDIQNFLMDRIMLRHNVITGRVEYRALDSMTPSGGDRGLNEGMFCACSDPQPPNLGGLWHLRKPVGIEGGIFMPVARAMQIVSANISQKISAVHLGRAFTDLGYKRVKHDSQRGYIVVQRTGEEIAAAQRAMADEATPERDSGQ